MKKGQLVELIVRACDPRPNPQVVEKWLDVVFSESVNTLFAKDPSNLDLYTKPYLVTVSGNEATIPVQTIQFTDSANGVRQIYVEQKKDLRFVPMKEGQRSVFSELEVGVSDASVGYVVKADRVAFDDNLPDYVKSVTMYVVPAPSELDSEDELLLPNGWTQETMIVSFMSKIKEPDKINQ